MKDSNRQNRPQSILTAKRETTIDLSGRREMRIVVLSSGLVLGVLMFIQTVLIAGLNSAVGDDNAATTETVGGVMSVMWLVACAMVLAFPMISTGIFGLAGLVGLAVGASSGFTDVLIWGLIALVLAIMSFLGWRDKNREVATADT
jgi:hypothetical protein